MTTAAALMLALFSISALLGGLGMAIVGARTVRRRRLARRARIIAPVRPALLELVAEDDAQEQQRLLIPMLRLDERTWRALEPTVSELLAKLRGSSHDVLRTLVERRGTVDRARRRTRRVGAVGRARAAEVLGGLEDARVTADLQRLLHDRDPEVRQVAARALGRSGDPAAAGPLLHCLARSAVPPRVVSQALLRLGAGAQQALVAALAEPSELLRAVAVEILGLSGAVGAARAVERALREDASLEVRIRAARALGKVGTRSSLDPLLACTALDEPVGLRAVSARALGDLGDPRAVPRLRELLDDQVHRVASNAGRSLSQMVPAGIAALEAEVATPASARSGAQSLEALVRTRIRSGAARQPAAPVEMRA